MMQQYCRAAGTRVSSHAQFAKVIFFGLLFYNVSSFSPDLFLDDSSLKDPPSSKSHCVRVAFSMLSSSSSHSSSSSISEGFNKPPTFIIRSRSCSLASLAACSRSSAKSSALSPANSLSDMRKSLRINLNLLRSLLCVKRLSIKELI